jgi:hypothetical protein
MDQSVNTLFINRNHRVIFNIMVCAILVLLSANSIAEVIPKNYNFTLDKFQIFKPGTNISDITAKYPTKELTFKEGNFTTYKYSIVHIRYKFPVFVQFANDKVTDFYAKLPSYFLHDLFHQSLINRIGPQDKFKKVEEQAIYIWNNKEGNKHIYFGSCTITCFPVYYSVQSNKFKKMGGGFKSLIKRFSEVEFKN